MEDTYPKLPDKKFDIIYADPPWHYNGKLQFDKSSKSKEKMFPSHKRIELFARRRVKGWAAWGLNTILNRN